MPGVGAADQVVADLAVRDRLDGDRDAAVGARAVGQRVGAPLADAVDVDADPDVLARARGRPSPRPGGSRWSRRRPSRAGRPRCGRAGRRRGAAGRTGRGSPPAAAGSWRARPAGPARRISARCAARGSVTAVLMHPACLADRGKVLTGRRELGARNCSEGTVHGSGCDRRPPPGAPARLQLDDQVVRAAARAPARRSPRQTVAAVTGGGAGLRRRARRRDGREHRGGRADGPRPASSSSPPAPGTPTPAPRSARPWTGRTTWAAARRATADRWTPCSPPTGSAPGWPGGTWPRWRREAGRRAPARWRSSPSWCSPTSTSCPRPASPGTPTSCRRAGGSASATASGWASTCSPAPARTCSPRPPSGPSWTPPTTLTAVLLPAAQLRGVLASLDAGHPRRSARTCRTSRSAAGTRSRCCWCPTPTGRPAAPAAGARRTAGRGRSGPAVVAGPRVVRPGARTAALVPADDGAGRHRGPPRRAGRTRRPGRPRRPAGPGARAAGRPAARPAGRDSSETLRSWLLHQGRRDEVAAELHVHAQTVRYRMGQLRELYGDRLDDPATVLDLVLALERRRARRLGGGSSPA